ncbi:MAG: YgiQ family radical SAM protein, partial [Lentisphaeria bacterium]
MFIPTTREELKKLKWHRPDIILVTGDSYIDSPFIGVAIIGKVLMKAGFKVAIIAQPDLESNIDITRLGNPRLFWGVTAGCMDSMVANYTAQKKHRNSDDFTPGGINNRRPDRASIQYTNLIRRHFKETAPIVLGGVEASLRRVTHYDFWSNKLRRSLLFDAKADFLSYGMGERSMVELAECLRDGKSTENICGLCYASSEKPLDALELPSFAECVADKMQFIKMFAEVYRNNDPKSAKKLIQLQDNRWLVQNPPAPYLSGEELDAVHELDYELAQHPYYEVLGKVKALETIKFSIPTHRGCYGECNFCAIAMHQGRTVRWRSSDSVVNEAKKLTNQTDFKGMISDLGGPTANMYGFECPKKLKLGACQDKRCLYPNVCNALPINHQPQLDLLEKLEKVGGVKKIFIGSGIRYDLILKDQELGHEYLKTIVDKHVSGQMKVAPEHISPDVLKLMGKPNQQTLIKFKKMFDELNKQSNKNQYLTYYLIAAHPGCSEEEMQEMKEFASKDLQTNPEQVQIFTPTPSTWASVMYYTEIDPFTGEKIFVEKDFNRKQRQKDILT